MPSGKFRLLALALAVSAASANNYDMTVGSVHATLLQCSDAASTKLWGHGTMCQQMIHHKPALPIACMHGWHVCVPL